MKTEDFFWDFISDEKEHQEIHVKNEMFIKETKREVNEHFRQQNIQIDLDEILSEKNTQFTIREPKDESPINKQPRITSSDGTIMCHKLLYGQSFDSDIFSQCEQCTKWDSKDCPMF